MKHKLIGKFFLFSLSFLALSIIFSCKGGNIPDNPPNTGEQGFQIDFNVDQSDQGSIEATVNGKAIKSGDRVKKGDTVVFVVEPNPGFTIEDWLGEGVKQDARNLLKATLKVSAQVTVTAKLKADVDPELKLHSLSLYGKGVDITNLDDVKIEVENFVKTLNANNVMATFTYKNQNEPQSIAVVVYKNDLSEGDNLLTLRVLPVKGKYRYWKQVVKITRKVAPPPNNDNVEEIVKAIDVALLTAKKKGGRYKYKEYVPLDNFKTDNQGPYATEDAQTAYIAIRLKAEKSISGDYKFEFTNKNTYIKYNNFERGSGENEDYLFLKDIALSKGYNTLEIEIKSKKGNSKGKYTIIINYSGGPNLDELALKDRKILPGVYCPAQRKHLDGESPDYVWVMCIAGW